ATTTVDPSSLLTAQASRTRVPQRVLIDVVAFVDIALVVLAAMVARSLYIAPFSEDASTIQPYLVAGIAGGIVVHYVMRTRHLHEPHAILSWRSRIDALLFSVGLSFLVLIAVAFLLKISASYSRGWLLTWLVLSA